MRIIHFIDWIGNSMIAAFYNRRLRKLQNKRDERLRRIYALEAQLSE